MANGFQLSVIIKVIINYFCSKIIFNHKGFYGSISLKKEDILILESNDNSLQQSYIGDSQ